MKKIDKNIFSLTKNYNLLKLRNQRAKTARISYIPSKFSFTITNKCNLRCPTCQYLLKEPAFFDDSGFMDVNNYENILEKYHKYITQITLTGGESTLHPDIDQFINISKSFDLRVAIISNGILITEKISSIQKLRDLRDLSITADAYDFESFARNRGGTKKQWEYLIGNLKALKQEGIKFKISFLATSKNIDDLHKMIEFADTYEPDTLNINSINPHGSEKDLVLFKSDRHVREAVSIILKRTDYSYNIKLPNMFDDKHPYHQKKICIYPWHGAYIDTKCNVSYCCQLPHNAAIGNICADYDFNSAKMVAWRNLLLSHTLPVDCEYCHRRFRGDYTKFSASKRKWKINHPIQDVY